MAVLEKEQVSEEVFALSNKRFGFVPNLLNVMNQHPYVLKMYADGVFLLEDNGVLNPKEQQIIYLAISAVNKCHYCVAAHGFVSKNVAGLSDEEINKVKNGELTNNERYNNLIEATRLIMEKQGWLEKSEVESLLAKGIDKLQVMEIIGLLSLKTLTNYINHIENTEVDAAFGV